MAVSITMLVVSRAIRYDLGELEPPRYHANGTVTVDARITRAGVFEYMRQDGTIRREYRPPEMVFATMDAFANTVVTDDHPPELITADNASQYARGLSGESIRRDGDHVRARLTVTDAGLIAKMKAGKRQVSNGYIVELDETPGIAPDGTKYDAIQVSQTPNHIAIVDIGRAGSAASVRMDGALGEVVHEFTAPLNRKQGDRMSKIKFDGVEYDDAQTALATAQVKLDASDKAREKLAGEVEVLTAAVATEKQLRADVEKSIPARVQARVGLEVEARKHLGDDVKLDALDDNAVKAAVVEKLTGVKLDEKASADRIDGAYLIALKGAEGSNAGLDAVRVAVSAGSRVDATETPEAAHARMVERNRNAWKTPNGKGAE